ncbi:MAG: hypothetical protein J3K34DRAFT_474210 [Monoraphidium minutum]|nr:MAG: hypothetical protein J3K34DRAFT_474210 [Monoraphidium minutum]
MGRIAQSAACKGGGPGRPRARAQAPACLAAALEGAEGLGGDAGGRGPAGPGPFMSVPDAVMGRGGSAFGDEGDVGSGSALGTMLHRNRVNIIMPSPPESAPKLDDGVGGGGLGKNNHNGGGGGDGGGDDDDYFGGGEGDGEGEGGGGGGDSFFRLRIPELFDRAALTAVMQEWMKTIADLPLFIRRSVEMGLFSSAQLVRFLAMDVRPGVTRAVTRSLPTNMAREFVGRLMADPAFVQKLAVEQALAFSASMLHEWRVRGDAFKSELDLALINSVGLATSVGAAVWITAPSRAVGAVHVFPWQKMLAGLPHCVFDASGPLRAYTPAARVGGFFASMAQLSAVGAAAGAATTGLSSLAVAARRRADPSFEPSVPVPELGRASGGLGAFFAVNANARYQLLGGMDRYLFGHASALWSYVALTATARAAACAAGELSRPWWQGLATETAASHTVRRTRVRKVKRRVVKRAAAAAAPQQQLEMESEQQAALAALVAAGGGLAVAQRMQQQHNQQRAAARAAGLSGAGSEAGETGEAGARGSEGGLESDVERRLGAAPALMGSPEGLAALARQETFSGSAMGAALRDAMSEEAAV